MGIQPHMGGSSSTLSQTDFDSMLSKSSDYAKFVQSLDGVDLSTITSNATAVKALQSQIGDTDLTKYRLSDIGANSGAIATNTKALSALQGQLKGIDLTKIASNSDQISKNTNNISTNTTNIKTNTTNIKTNTKDIASNASNINGNITAAATTLLTGDASKCPPQGTPPPGVSPTFCTIVNDVSKNVVTQKQWTGLGLDKVTYKDSNWTFAGGITAQDKLTSNKEITLYNLNADGGTYRNLSIKPHVDDGFNTVLTLGSGDNNLIVNGNMTLATEKTTSPSPGPVKGGNFSVQGSTRVTYLTASGTVQGGTLTDGTATVSKGNVTGVNGLTASGTVQGGTLTDGTAKMSKGNVTSVNGLTASGTVQGGTLTDGTAKMSKGNVTSVNGLTASGTVQGGTLTDGTAKMSKGNVSNVMDLTAVKMTLTGHTTRGACNDALIKMPNVDDGQNVPYIVAGTSSYIGSKNEC